MTVPSGSGSKIIYDGDGIVDEFDFTFPIFSASDIRVVLTDADGIETDLVLDAADGFTVTFDSELPSAGTVTYPWTVNGSVLADGETITLLRAMGYSQETDLTNAGAYRAEAVENALDKLTMLVLQLREQIDRVLIVPVSTPSGVSMELPSPEAGSMIGWNGSADGLTNIAADGTGILEQIDSETFVINHLSGTGAQTEFTLSDEPGHINAVEVCIDGVTQHLVDSSNNAQFSISGTTLTFATAPPTGTRNIQVRWRQYVNTAAAVLTDGSVTGSKLASGAVTFEKMAGECAIASQTCTAQTLTNTTSTSLLSFSTSLAGPSTPKLFSFLLTCTHASGDLAYAQGDTVVIDADWLRDGSNHYGILIQSVSTSGFSIRTGSNGIVLPHKNLGSLYPPTANRWTITPSVVGW